MNIDAAADFQTNHWPSTGMIRAPRPEPSHVCSGMPGFWARLWSALNGQPVYNGSLYRCTCGIVYCLRTFGSWDSLFLSDNIIKWVKAGGIINEGELGYKAYKMHLDGEDIGLYDECLDEDEEDED